MPGWGVCGVGLHCSMALYSIHWDTAKVVGPEPIRPILWEVCAPWGKVVLFSVQALVL